MDENIRLKRRTDYKYLRRVFSPIPHCYSVAELQALLGRDWRIGWDDKLQAYVIEFHDNQAGIEVVISEPEMPRFVYSTLEGVRGWIDGHNIGTDEGACDPYC